MAVTMNITIFWVVTLCTLLDTNAGTYCLHRQGRKRRQIPEINNLHIFLNENL
jgi:hypothetical protein